MTREQRIAVLVAAAKHTIHEAETEIEYCAPTAANYRALISVVQEALTILAEEKIPA